MFSQAFAQMEKWKRSQSPTYELVEPQLKDTGSSCCQQSGPGVSFLWVLSTFIFAFLFGFSEWRQYNQLSWSYEKGFRTDFVAAHSAIGIEEVRFTSGVWIDDNGTFHLAEHPGLPTYVGPPNSKIDKAWDDIVEPEWFHATEEEIQQRGGKDLANKLSRNTKGLYSAELDVFHSLHCLNQIRKAIDRDYYYPSYGPRNEVYINYMHWDHCIDQLRQVLQCHGDTTMNGAIYYPGGNKSFVDTEDIHTCRNFTRLREWGKKRAQLDMS